MSFLQFQRFYRNLNTPDTHSDYLSKNTNTRLQQKALYMTKSLWTLVVVKFVYLRHTCKQTSEEATLHLLKQFWIYVGLQCAHPETNTFVLHERLFMKFWRLSHPMFNFGLKI